MKLSERVRRLSSGYQGMDDQASIARDIDTLESENARLKEAVRVMRDGLKLSSIRLEILTGRMRGCNEETGKHELLDEAVAFCEESKEDLSTVDALLKSEGEKE